MMRWEQSRTWLMRLFLIALLFLLASCPAPGGEGCGGVDAFVSCVKITSIQPTSTAGDDSSDVDVVQTPDCDGDPTTLDAEPFTKHDANITFSNQPFPTADDALPVTIRGFTVTYSLAICPTGAVCPPLTGFSESVALAIPVGGTTGGQFSMVPISVKFEFVNNGGTANAFPTYIANYTFTAETDFFEDSFTIPGSVSFVLGNFNLCPA